MVKHILRGGILCFSLVLIGASAQADPLFVIASSIPNGQVLAGPNVSLVLTFNVPFDPTSTVAGDLSLLDPLSNSVVPNFFSIDATDTILTIGWGGLFLGGTYKYTIANINDLADGDQMAPFSGNFVIPGSTVPEASSLLLLGTGLLGVLATSLKRLRR
jgi:hypothetical protein